MKLTIIQIISASLPLWLPISESAAPLTTRQQTIIPLDIPPGTPVINPSNVPLYAVYGYSAWRWGPGTNQGVRLDLMPAGYTGPTHAARLLSYFSISDAHITDKESPAAACEFGWTATNGQANLPIYIPCYAPVLFSTTQVLNAAIKTINALHRLTPFDFGLNLGDAATCNQYNALRWFIDVMDGQYITPSSGANLGATNIDYQEPFQAAGLNPSIPWYEVIGNHDQFWMGSQYPTDKTRAAMVGSNVLDMSPVLFSVNATEGVGEYVGVIDGTTPYGTVIKGGYATNFATPPTVVADANRRGLTTEYSSTTNYMSEFFNTVSSPVGHGFSRGNIDSNSACYSFEPLTNLPLKVIVFDDMAKTNIPNPLNGPLYCSSGVIDAARYAWLTNELQAGQDSNQLMILAMHIPINPQNNVNDTNHNSPEFDGNARLGYSSMGDTNLIAALQQYPNLILLMASHRHINTVTPQPSSDPAHPENGFWEVETPSLRDFPQQFRTWEILRNTDNSISIVTTDVDPVVQTNTPEGKSRGYAIGTARVFGSIELTNSFSHTYNAELVKLLTPAMQAKIAGYGGPLGHLVSLDLAGTEVTLNFMGTLQSADTLSGPWTDVPGTTNYQYSTTAQSGVKFYRAVE